MNARSLYKKIVNKKVKTLFGTRSFVTVTVPESIYPIPYPKFVTDFEFTGIRGHYEKRIGNRTHVISIDEVCTSLYPYENREEYFLTENFAGKLMAVYGCHPGYEDEETHLDNWWEGKYSIFEGEGLFSHNLVETGPLDRETMASHAKACNWEKTFVYGYPYPLEFEKIKHFPMINLLQVAQNPCKTLFLSEVQKPGKISITYSLKNYKGFYRRRIENFCNYMRQLVKMGKYFNVPVEIRVD